MLLTTFMNDKGVCVSTNDGTLPGFDRGALLEIIHHRIGVGSAVIDKKSLFRFQFVGLI